MHQTPSSCPDWRTWALSLQSSRCMLHCICMQLERTLLEPASLTIPDLWTGSGCTLTAWRLRPKRQAKGLRWSCFATKGSSVDSCCSNWPAVCLQTARVRSCLRHAVHHLSGCHGCAHMKVFDCCLQSHTSHTSCKFNLAGQLKLQLHCLVCKVVCRPCLTKRPGTWSQYYQAYSSCPPVRALSVDWKAPSLDIWDPQASGKGPDRPL